MSKKTSEDYTFLISELRRDSTPNHRTGLFPPFLLFKQDTIYHARTSNKIQKSNQGITD
jgi:hypothetical protein